MWGTGNSFEWSTKPFDFKGSEAPQYRLLPLLHIHDRFPHPLPHAFQCIGFFHSLAVSSQFLLIISIKGIPDISTILPPEHPKLFQVVQIILNEIEFWENRDKMQLKIIDFSLFLPPTPTHQEHPISYSVPYTKIPCLCYSNPVLQNKWVGVCMERQRAASRRPSSGFFAACPKYFSQYVANLFTCPHHWFKPLFLN